MTAILVEGRRINPPPVGIRWFGQPSAPDLSLRLTFRELEVMRALAHGLTRKEVAAEQHVAMPTVQTHMSNAFLKLGAQSLVQAMNLLGWVCTDARP
jgi:DNA-binding NarL/FixJ family response regulator